MCETALIILTARQIDGLWHFHREWKSKLSPGLVCDEMVFKGQMNAREGILGLPLCADCQLHSMQPSPSKL